MEALVLAKHTKRWD